MSRKRGSTYVNQYIDYLAEIESWATNYSFSIGKGYSKNLPYTEHADLTIQAKVIAPKKHCGKEINLVILLDREIDKALNDPYETQPEPTSIGKLTLRGDRREYIGFLPATALNHIVLGLDNKRYKYVSLNGHNIRYGSAQIDGIAFKEEYDPDNY